MTLGSEATIVRDVIVENCRITGNVSGRDLEAAAGHASALRRHYVPQYYFGATAGAILAVQPWSQYVNLQGAAPPASVVHNLSLIGIKGNYTSFGTIRPNPGQTEISDVLLKDFDVVLRRDKLAASGVTNPKYENVIVNGQPQSA